jgi:hypothetical protein
VMLENVGSQYCTIIWLKVFPPPCIPVSGTTRSDLLNSLESPNTSNCGNPNTFWSFGVLRNCGTHRHTLGWQIKCDSITLENALDNSYVNHLLGGSTLKTVYNTYIS